MTQITNSQKFLRVFTDVVVIALCWILAFVLRFHTPLPVPKGTPEFSHYLKLIPLIALSWGFILGTSSVYNHPFSIRRTNTGILKSCFIATLLFLASTSFYHEFRYSRGALLIFVVIHPIALGIWHSVQRKMQRKSPQVKTLVIASSERLKQVESMLNLEEIGAVIQVSENLRESRLPLSPPPKDWLTFLSSNDYTHIMIFIHPKDSGILKKLLPLLVEQALDIQVIPDIEVYSLFDLQVDMIKGTPVIQLQACPLSGVNTILKRIVDLTGACLAIFIFSPIMLMLSLLIPLFSRGPILYKQTRIGVDGKSFSILKFRSMPISAEAQTGAIFATPQDNRANWLGKIIRKTSLDELPQLFNVLKGDMSLVGPRPERPVFVEQFRREIPAYMLRHKVRAGMTGWAQINGWRGNTSIHKRIEYDLYYIQHWSFWLDFKILVLTIFKGFISPQAY